MSKRETNIPELVEAIERAGATFIIRPGGCLFVEGLAEIPAELRERFYACDPPALVAFVKGRTSHNGAQSAAHLGQDWRHCAGD